MAPVVNTPAPPLPTKAIETSEPAMNPSLSEPPGAGRRAVCPSIPSSIRLFADVLRLYSNPS
jgi:hypothetical protein